MRSLILSRSQLPLSCAPLSLSFSLASLPLFTLAFNSCLSPARATVKHLFIAIMCRSDHVHYTDLLAKFSIRVLYCSTRLFIIAHAHYAHCTWELSGLLDMALSIMKMGPVLFGSIEDLIAYLQGKGLFASNKLCPNCSSKRY